MLLVGAGLLLRSARELSRVKPGFDRTGCWPSGLAFGDSSIRRANESLERLRAIPGVKSVAVTSQLPVSGRGIGAWFNILSRPTPPGVTPTGEAYRVVSPNYFSTVRIPLIRGRGLADDDRRGVHRVVVINEALAKKYWPRAIRSVKPSTRRTGQPLLRPGHHRVDIRWAREQRLRADPLPQVFASRAGPLLDCLVRGADRRVIRWRSALQSVLRCATSSPIIPVRNMWKAMTDVLDESVAEDRLALKLLGAMRRGRADGGHRDLPDLAYLALPADARNSAFDSR
ncbi:MAG: hypothetical protein U0163_17490 [Gemmatimonadaceae bacterium]